MKRINLAIYIDDITVLGGVEKVTYSFYCSLKNKTNYNLRLLSLFQEKDSKYPADIDFLFFKHSKPNTRNIEDKISEYLEKRNINVLIAEVNDLKKSVLLGKISKNKGIKILFVLHNTPKMYLANFASIADCLYKPSLICRKIYKAFIGGPSNYFKLKNILSYGKVITVGKSCGNELKQYFPKYENKISSIYNINNLSKGAIKTSKTKKILYMGRFSLQKDLLLLLSLWKNFTLISDEYELLLIGDGEEKEKILDKIEKKQIKRISVLGRVDNVEYYYSHADVCILTSHYEGLPTVFLEALSQNCYLFAAKSYGGTGELIKNNINGFYSQTRNPKILAQELYKFLKKIRIPNDIGILPIEFSEDFIIEKWNKLIREELDEDNKEIF